MNWQTRTVVLFFFSLITLYSCDNPDVEMDLDGQTQLGTNFTDTFKVTASTVLTSDSILANRGNFLVGRLADNTFGTVTATAFTEIGIASSSFVDAPNATIDSMVFSLDYDEYYGDTTQDLTVRVHRLTEAIVEDRTYYTHNSLPYEATPLGTRTFKPTPRKVKKELSADGKTTLFRALPARVRLNNSLAQEILAQSGKTPLSTQKEFVKFLPGFAITADNNAKAVLGFKPAGTASSDSTYIKIYYKSGGVRRTYLLYPVSSNNRFNQVISTRANTPLAALQNTGDSVASRQTNNFVFLQESTRIKAKISFPYLERFRQKFSDQDNIILNRAELVIPVAPGQTNVSPYLYAFETNKSNRILRAQPGTSGQVAPRALSGDGAQYPAGYASPAFFRYSATTNSYTLNVTSYVQDIIYGIHPKNHSNGTGRNLPEATGLILSPSSLVYGTSTGVNDLLGLQTLRQTVLSVTPANQPKLRLYYSVAKK